MSDRIREIVERECNRSNRPLSHILTDILSALLSAEAPQAAPEREGKPLLTEWRRFDGNKVDSRRIAGTNDDVVHAEVGGYWSVWAAGHSGKKLASDRMVDLQAARDAADAWIRANPVEAPGRLPVEPPTRRALPEVVEDKRAPSTAEPATGDVGEALAAIDYATTIQDSATASEWNHAHDLLVRARATIERLARDLDEARTRAECCGVDCTNPPMICRGHLDGMIRAEGEEVRAQLATVTARIATIADEAFGPFPVQSVEESLSAIEGGIFEQRRALDEAETGHYRRGVEDAAKIIDFHGGDWRRSLEKVRALASDPERLRRIVEGK